MIGKMKFFIMRPWTSQMVENNKKQHRWTDVTSALRRSDHPRIVMDLTQRWDDTPQGHDYWSHISFELENQTFAL